MDHHPMVIGTTHSDVLTFHQHLQTNTVTTTTTNDISNNNPYAHHFEDEEEEVNNVKPVTKKK